MNASIDWQRLQGHGHWRADDARRALAELKRSGESRAAFARRHAINPQRLGWWSSRLGAATASVTLVPVTVREDASPRLRPPALSLVVGEQIHLDIVDAERVPPAWLAAVIDAIARSA